MRLSYIVFLLSLFSLFLLACEAPAALPEGRWTGALTPMNHPEMENPIAYEVSHPEGKLAVSVISPSGSSVPTQNPRVDSDTLRFAFEEPEEGILLTCALAWTDRANAHFAGRCTDDNGKWARFTMIPPDA